MNTSFFSTSGWEHRIVFKEQSWLVDDEELLELVEMEIRDLLQNTISCGDTFSYPRFSSEALEAANLKYEDIIRINDDTVDEYIPEPERYTDKPLLLPVEDVFNHQTWYSYFQDVSTVVLFVPTTKSKSLVSKTKPKVALVLKCRCKQLNEGLAGDNVGVLLRGNPTWWNWT